MNHASAIFVRVLWAASRRPSVSPPIIDHPALVNIHALFSLTHPVGPTLLCALLLGGLNPTVAAPASSAPPADTTNPQVQRFLIQGTTQTQLGDYEEAITYFEAALEQAPEEPVLLDALAEAYEAQGDLATALFYAQQAQTRGSSCPYYYHRLAKVQRAAEEPAAALSTYERLLDQLPNHTAAYRTRATLQADLGRTEAAVQSYETYLTRVDRPPISVYRRLLSLYREMGETEGIEETLRILVDRRPNHRIYRRRLGEHYANENRPAEALTLLAPLARQFPDDTALQHQVRQLAHQTGQPVSVSVGTPGVDSLAQSRASTDELVHRAQSKYDAAIASSPPDTTRLRTAEDLLQRALNRSPNHKAALSLRARLYEAWGRPEQAGRMLERLLELDPRTSERWTRAARAYQQAHLYADAANVAEEGFLLFPGHTLLVRIAGFARLHSNASARARDHFRDALSLLDDSADAGERAVLHAGLGLAYSRLDRPEEAIEALERARSLAPDHPKVLRLYAMSLALRNERLDHALDLAEQAVEQAPESPSAHHTLGWVHFRRNEVEAARRHLRIALDTGSPSATLLERFGDVQQALGNDAAAQTYWQRAADRAPDRSSLREKLKAPANS